MIHGVNKPWEAFAIFCPSPLLLFLRILVVVALASWKEISEKIYCDCCKLTPRPTQLCQIIVWSAKLSSALQNNNFGTSDTFYMTFSQFHKPTGVYKCPINRYKIHNVHYSKHTFQYITHEHNPSGICKLWRWSPNDPFVHNCQYFFYNSFKLHFFVSPNSPTHS